MENFELNERLAAECLVLGKLDLSLLLLMNNALVPWFILVPLRDVTEMTDLPWSDQATLLEEINLMADFIKKNFPVLKLNIAAIGNIVSQLHVHIVGRDPSDCYWPRVVWGAKERESYSEERIREITGLLGEQLGGKLS